MPVIIPKDFSMNCKEYDALREYLREKKEVVLVYKSKNGNEQKEAIFKGEMFAVNENLIQLTSTETVDGRKSSFNKGFQLSEGLEIYLKEEYNPQ